MKTVDGTTHYYGVYDNLEDAVRARTYWIQNDWNLSLREEYLEQYRGFLYNKNPVNLYINKNGTGWTVSRTRNRKRVYYGTYPYLSEARRIRDLLVENDWNTEKVIVKKRKRNKEDKYICRNGKYYEVRRGIKREDGSRELVIFDSGIPTIEEARELRDWWVEHDWDWSEI